MNQNERVHIEAREEERYLLARREEEGTAGTDAF